MSNVGYLLAVLLACAWKPRVSKFCFFQLVAAALVVGTFVTNPLAAQERPTTSCYEISFPDTRPFIWPTSGAWSADGQHLLIADTFERSILGVSLTSGQVINWSQLASAIGVRYLQPQSPQQLRAVGDDGWLLYDKRQSAEIVRLNSLLEPLPETSSLIRVQGRTLVNNGNAASRVNLKWIYDFAPMGQGILTFGDIAGPGDQLRSAFIYFDESGQSQIFGTVDNLAPARFLFVRNIIRYLASIGDVGFILLLDGDPKGASDTLKLARVRFGTPDYNTMPFFPEQFQDRLDLDELPTHGPRKATRIFKRLEDAPIAVGIYAWNRDLYLLAKDAKSEIEGTAWWLVKVDPQDGAELSRVRLPTGAAHLTVVPGKDFWALIEKSPVDGIGKLHAPFMDTPSMLLIPTAWLEDLPDSPLFGESDVACAAIP